MDLAIYWGDQEWWAQQVISERNFASDGLFVRSGFPLRQKVYRKIKGPGPIETGSHCCFLSRKLEWKPGKAGVGATPGYQLHP